MLRVDNKTTVQKPTFFDKMDLIPRPNKVFFVGASKTFINSSISIPPFLSSAIRRAPSIVLSQTRGRGLYPAHSCGNLVGYLRMGMYTNIFPLNPFEGLALQARLLLEG
jgi:hypothetical protein